MMVRNVLLSDAEAIRNIYNYYIRTSVATFTEQEFSLADVEAKIRDLQRQDYPFLCACDDSGNCIGFAYLSAFRKPSAYRLAESTIYLAADRAGKGIGGRLYKELIERARESGAYSGIIAVVTSENRKSIDFHFALGFEKCGAIPNSGVKFGQWYGIEFLRLPLECHQ